MEKRDFTLPELEKNLESLAEGALHSISRSDYERLFGTNGAAPGRLRNFARAHECVAIFNEKEISFQRGASKQVPQSSLSSS